jgi:hypothetical protein
MLTIVKMVLRELWDFSEIFGQVTRYKTFTFLKYYHVGLRFWIPNWHDFVEYYAFFLAEIHSGPFAGIFLSLATY